MHNQKMVSENVQIPLYDPCLLSQWLGVCVWFLCNLTGVSDLHRDSEIPQENSASNEAQIQIF